MTVKPKNPDPPDPLLTLQDLHYQCVDLEMEKARALVALQAIEDRLANLRQAIAKKMASLKLGTIGSHVVPTRVDGTPISTPPNAAVTPPGENINATWRIRQVLLAAPDGMSRENLLSKFPDVPVKSVDGALLRLRREGVIETIPGLRGKYRPLLGNAKPAVLNQAEGE